MAVKLPVRAVTARAKKARPWPARPAAYGRRYADKRRGKTNSFRVPRFLMKRRSSS